MDKEKGNQYARVYRESHREELRERQRIYRQLHQEQLKESQRRYSQSEKGKTKRRELAKKYYQANPLRREKQKQWYIEQKHPCIDCGKPCSYGAIRCNSCARKGYLGSNWKGGRIYGGGYVLLLSPHHPRANHKGYVLEHILVWEKAHGKPLPSGWVIHHLNGIRHDNRPQNLMALPDRKHRHILAAKSKRIQELEALLNNQHQLI